MHTTKDTWNNILKTVSGEKKLFIYDLPSAIALHILVELNSTSDQTPY